MFASEPVTGGFYVGNNTQPVAFRPALARFVPRLGWRTIGVGVWKYTTAADNEFGAYAWTDPYGQPTYSNQSFLVPVVGTYQAPEYYAAYIEYKWLADATHSYGYTWAYTPHHEMRGSPGDQSVYWGCKYPGPNAITMIG
jgi:hypothetical protein